MTSFNKTSTSHFVKKLNVRTCFVSSDGLLWITIEGGTGSGVCDNPTDLRIITFTAVPNTSVNTQSYSIIMELIGDQ